MEGVALGGATSRDSERVEVGDEANCLYHALAVALKEAGVGNGVGWHRIRQEVRVFFLFFTTLKPRVESYKSL